MSVIIFKFFGIVVYIIFTNRLLFSSVDFVLKFILKIILCVLKTYLPLQCRSYDFARIKLLIIKTILQ